MLENIQIKKRIPNIIAGLVFGVLAIKLTTSFWSYVFYVISALLFVYADQIIRMFSVKLHDEIKLKDSVEVVVRDKAGNIKDSYSSKQN